MTNHHITAADNTLIGRAFFTMHAKLYDGRRGYLANIPSYRALGAVLAVAANALVSAATGAELPNAATITYTAANDGVSPIDGAGKPALAAVQMADGKTYSVWPLDVPRNAVMSVTHATSIVALSCLVSGFDEYGVAISETLAVTATGTAKTANGKKAFKWILSYAFTSAGDATADTAGIAWGNVLGLRYRASDLTSVMMNNDGKPDGSATVVKADDTNPPTATTGDSRGTVTPNSAPDGTKTYAVWQVPSDPTSVKGLFGIAAYLLMLADIPAISSAN